MLSLKGTSDVQDFFMLILARVASLEEAKGRELKQRKWVCTFLQYSSSLWVENNRTKKTFVSPYSSYLCNGFKDTASSHLLLDLLKITQNDLMLSGKTLADWWQFFTVVTVCHSSVATSDLAVVISALLLHEWHWFNPPLIRRRKNLRMRGKHYLEVKSQIDRAGLELLRCEKLSRDKFIRALSERPCTLNVTEWRTLTRIDAKKNTLFFRTQGGERRRRRQCGIWRVFCP